MTDIETVFRKFLGNWEITREIRSIASNELKAESTGTAEFTSVSENELSYEEKGTIIQKSDGQTNNFFSNYRYVLNGVEIEVYMRHPDKKYDGKLYQSYSLDGEKLVARETHICELDYYKGFYELIDENQFNLITEQEGPKKDNMIRTKFRRLL